jgi:hypothetical protein
MIKAKQQKELEERQKAAESKKGALKRLTVRSTAVAAAASPPFQKCGRGVRFGAPSLCYLVVSLSLPCPRPACPTPHSSGDEESPPQWRPSNPPKVMTYADKRALFGGSNFEYVPDPVPEFQVRARPLGGGLLGAAQCVLFEVPFCGRLAGGGAAFPPLLLLLLCSRRFRSCFRSC